MLTPYSARVARFTIYTGVLKLLSEQFVGCAQEQPLRGLIEETRRHAAKTLGTVPWKLDEPIWTVGSKLCGGRKCGARKSTKKGVVSSVVRRRSHMIR